MLSRIKSHFGIIAKYEAAKNQLQNISLYPLNFISFAVAFFDFRHFANLFRTLLLYRYYTVSRKEKIFLPFISQI